ncbi:hypothetical protein [Pseudonocardia acaciae]|uniref:hypothetical protein n=1 Tax=Pseudonocardia acaciae TaxID=551276 RepID=UPI0012EECE61|nr:hypothetical protein [Pseudonocardia acaciae]
MEDSRHIRPFLRKNLVYLPDIVAVAAAIAVFIKANVTSISNETLVQTASGLLALMVMTLLILRVTKIEKMDDGLSVIQREVKRSGALEERLSSNTSRIATRLSEIARFLEGGSLDERLRATALSSNSSLQNFHAAGITHVHASLQEVDLVDEFGRARRSIRIISTWVGCLLSLGEVLVAKAREGCEIRILVVQHTSTFARLRSLELDPGNEDTAPRSIANELCEFNRIFHQHPDVKGKIQVKAYDARPPMCLFSYDHTRLLGSLWPGVNAMDGPFIRVVGEGDPSVQLTLGRLADSAFERVWNDRTTCYVRVIDGVPEYTDRPELAWYAEGQIFASILDDYDQLDATEGKEGQQKVVNSVARDEGRARVAALELHQKLRSKEFGAAAKLVRILDAADSLKYAETVLIEAIDAGYTQFRQPLIKFFLQSAREAEAETLLRQGVVEGDYFSIFRLVQHLDASGRSDEVEPVLRDGAAARNSRARRSLINLLDTTNRSFEANQLLGTWYSAGDSISGHDLAVRLHADGDVDRATKILLKLAELGDADAQRRLTDLKGELYPHAGDQVPGFRLTLVSDPDQGAQGRGRS